MRKFIKFVLIVAFVFGGWALAAASLHVVRAPGTMAWGYGDSAAIEASALGALALLETGQDMELARQLLAFLQSKSSSNGGWGSTHATVLTLKALSKAASTVRQKDPIRVVVEVNGNNVKMTRPIEHLVFDEK